MSFSEYRNSQEAKDRRNNQLSDEIKASIKAAKINSETNIATKGQVTAKSQRQMDPFENKPIQAFFD